MTGRNLAAHLTAVLGGAVVLIEVVRYWIWSHPISGIVVAIGFAIAFVGAYMSDHKGALEGGNFIVSAFLDGVAVLRSGKRAGRRSTDAIVVEPDSPLPEAPSAQG